MDVLVFIAECRQDNAGGDIAGRDVERLCAMLYDAYVGLRSIAALNFRGNEPLEQSIARRVIRRLEVDRP